VPVPVPACPPPPPPLPSDRPPAAATAGDGLYIPDPDSPLEELHVRTESGCSSMPCWLDRPPRPPPPPPSLYSLLVRHPGVIAAAEICARPTPAPVTRAASEAERSCCAPSSSPPPPPARRSTLGELGREGGSTSDDTPPLRSPSSSKSPNLPPSTPNPATLTTRESRRRRDGVGEMGGVGALAAGVLETLAAGDSSSDVVRRSLAAAVGS